MPYVKDLLVLFSAHSQLNTEKLVDIAGLVPSWKQKTGKTTACWKAYSMFPRHLECLCWEAIYIKLLCESCMCSEWLYIYKQKKKKKVIVHMSQTFVSLTSVCPKQFYLGDTTASAAQRNPPKLLLQACGLAIYLIAPEGRIVSSADS